MLEAKTAPKPREMSSKARIYKIELALLIILLLLGFTLRIWNISSVGLDHFDEGVYAFSALGLTDSNQPHRLYPGQTKISPPVFFSLVDSHTSFLGDHLILLLYLSMCYLEH